MAFKSRVLLALSIFIDVYVHTFCYMSEICRAVIMLNSRSVGVRAYRSLWTSQPPFAGCCLCLLLQVSTPCLRRQLNGGKALPTARARVSRTGSESRTSTGAPEKQSFSRLLLYCAIQLLCKLWIVGPLPRT